ncbi:MAG: hypothetical protein IJ093_02785 [Bacilli bacterium]|nr:hypothetical protein [Bacilli bacterium]
MCKTISSQLKKNILITNTNEVIAAEGTTLKKHLNYQLSEDLLKLIINRKEIITEDQTTITVTKDKIETGYYVIIPTIANSDVIGLIIMLSTTKITKEEEELIKIASKFLSNYIES